MKNIIIPNWSAPKHIHAFCTTRLGGESRDEYTSFNLAEHVGDVHERVIANRNILKKSLNLPTEPLWLKQTHSTHIINANDYSENVSADANFSTMQKQICLVMTADCLPILLTNRLGHFVMAVHAGWKGLADGILENALTLAKQFGPDVLVWLGPAINQCYYEVGDDVKQKFLERDTNNHIAFKLKGNRWLCDLKLIAKEQCRKHNVAEIFDHQECTFKNKDLFFSYRRDGKTGRMATGIFIK